MKRLDPISVLLLEDDEDYRRLLDKKLRTVAQPYEIDWVETATDAVLRLEVRSYDVILSDLTVPDSQGAETIVRLRKHGSTTPIIALTSLDDEDLQETIIASGGQDYLVKGETTGEEIKRAIQHAIQRQQAFNEKLGLMSQLAKSYSLLEEQAELLRKKNRRLQRLNKTAHEFVDNVSHDLRTPLTVIKDFVGLIREGLVGEINEEQRSMLDKVAVRADDLNHMVDDLLDVSKIEAGLLGCWRRSVSPLEMIDRAASMLQQRAAVKGVSFSADRPDDLPEVYCDMEKAGRVISNLAVNAIKFTPAGGNVRLWAEADPVQQQVVIGVTDDGPGIPPESLGELFGRFKQEDEGVKTETKGFGLGLSIAQKLVRLNLGQLSVRSQVGKGSTFSFTLPHNDATEVFRRWLGLRRDRLGNERLLELTASESEGADELDHFLTGLLRREDLLLRVADNRWLLAQVVSPSEAEAWCERAMKNFAKANRNRPAGPLPEFRINVSTVWRPSDSFDSRVQDFEAARPAAAPTAPEPLEV